MFRRRLHRRFHRLSTALFITLSLLFSQLALAAYVCPVKADAEAMAAMMEAGAPCDGMDEQQPLLCHQHAADPGKTFEVAKVPVASLPAIVQVLELPLVLDELALQAGQVTATSAARPPPDPIFLSTLRLRV